MMWAADRLTRMRATGIIGRQDDQISEMDAKASRGRPRCVRRGSTVASGINDMDTRFTEEQKETVGETERCLPIFLKE